MELIKQEVLTPAIFDEAKRLDTIINTVKHKAKEYEPDITTEKGRKECASFAFKIAKTKTAIDGIGKDKVADAKKAIKEIDNKRKYARDTLDELKDEVRKPLTDWENEEKERVEKHNNALNAIDLQTQGFVDRWLEFSVEDMEGFLKVLDASHSNEWQEFTQAATTKIQASYKAVEESIVKRKQYDKEQLELEALRKAQEEAAQKKRDEELIEKAKREERERIELEKEEVKQPVQKVVKATHKAVDLASGKDEAKITISIEGQLFSLTIQAAKELRDNLNQLIGE